MKQSEAFFMLGAIIAAPHISQGHALVYMGIAIVAGYIWQWRGK